jgi:hypothetical protein
VTVAISYRMGLVANQDVHRCTYNIWAWRIFCTSSVNLGTLWRRPGDISSCTVRGLGKSQHIIKNRNSRSIHNGESRLKADVVVRRVFLDAWSHAHCPHPAMHTIIVTNTHQSCRFHPRFSCWSLLICSWIFYKLTNTRSFVSGNRMLERSQ